ncbi:MAG: hypothetical protein WA610_06610 [Thermodesulfovibrionales bacterium]
MDDHSRDKGAGPCMLLELSCGAIIGKKRARLLDEINRIGSIRHAAEAADIPYEHALELVSVMNGSCASPLVKLLNPDGERISGWLTVDGENALQDFTHLYEDLKASVTEERRLRRSG